MRSGPLFLLFPLLFLAGCGHSYPNRTPEAFCKSLFTILRQDERAALDRFVPREDDLFAVLEGARPEDKDRKAMHRITRGYDKFRRDIGEALDAAMEEVRTGASDAGLDLAQAQFLRAAARSAPDPETQEADMDLWFTYGTDTFRIKVENALKAPRGWLLGRKAFEWKGIQ